MRILYHHRIASKDGQYVHVAEIISSLEKLGATIRVVAPAVSERQQFGGEASIVARLKRYLPKATYELLELGYSLVDFVRMSLAILSFKPTAIYERYNLFFPSGVFAARLFGVPLILEVNAPLYDERGKYSGLALSWLARWSERYVWRNADWVLPVTGVLAARVLQEGVDPRRLRVIPNGIDPGQFGPDVQPRALPWAGDHVVIGFVGFCREWHELDRVVALIGADRSQRLALVIVGDGPVIPELKAQAEALGCANRVHFAGLVGRDGIPSWLAAIDIAIQPAVVPYASPLKLIEYMAAGKAIVAPAQDNIRELLTHEHDALLFPCGDPQGLTTAIRRLAADDDLRRRLAVAARATIERKGLLWDENARQILAIAADLSAPDDKVLTD